MLHDYRPRCGIRASPHFYTTDDELRAFVDEIDRIRR
jgi:selenocysteine lyase/cysteine desulfurase